MDQSFGNLGIVKELNISPNWSNFFRVFCQNDGKIIAIGNSGATEAYDNSKFVLYKCSFFVARYNIDGSPCLSFGNNGKIKTEIKERFNGKYASDLAYSGAMQSNNKIIVVGRIEDSQVVEWDDLADGSESTDCAIVRYDINGNLDLSFGNDQNGVVINSFSNKDDFFTDVVVQPDDKIICIGAARNVNTNKVELALVRYTKNGLLDTEFGQNNNGIVLAPIGTGDFFAKNMALQKDGKVLVTGIAKFDDRAKFILIRYTNDGILDDTFGKGGILTTSLRDYDDKSYAISIQDDNKIIVAGESFNGKNFDFALVRYAPDNIAD